MAREEETVVDASPSKSSSDDNIPGPSEEQSPYGPWGPTKSKTATWHDPRITAEVVLEMSGIEFLRAIRDGALPPAPIVELLGMRFVTVESGLVILECEPDESVYNPIGTVHGGLVCTMADTVTACAVQTTLEKGTAYTSIDLSVSYLRPVTVNSGVLRATGTVTKPGRRVAFATAEIVDGLGKIVATATSSCLVMGSGA